MFNLTSHFSSSINPFNLLSKSFQYASSYFPKQFIRVFLDDEASFFMNMQMHPLFRRYEDWCIDIKRVLNSTYTDLIEGKIKLEDFEKSLQASLQQLDDDKIISPAFYAHQLKKITNKIDQKYGERILTYTDKLKEKLKENQDAAYSYFYSDILAHLVQLAGAQIDTEQFFQKLNYYSDVLPLDLYQNVIAKLQAFTASYSDADIKSFERLLGDVESLLLETTEVSLSSEQEVKSNSWLSDSFNFIKEHPVEVATGAIAAISALTYDYKNITHQDNYNSLSINSFHVVSGLNTISTMGLLGAYSYKHSQFGRSNTWQSIIGSTVALFQFADTQYIFNSGTFNISTVNGVNGFATNAGNFVTGNCDFNGDGKKDYFSMGASNRVVIYGGIKNFPSYYDVDGLLSEDGVQFTGIDGYSVACGDFDADGCDDVVIGCYTTGQVYLVYGCKGITNPFNVAANTDTTLSFGIQGLGDPNCAQTNNCGQFGNQVAVCDLNNDGYKDIIASAPYLETTLGTGAVFGIFGTSDLFPSMVNMATLLANGQAFALNSTTTSSFLGAALACSNINGDAYDDLVTSEVTFSNTYVYFGHAGTFDSNPIGTAISNGKGSLIQVGTGNTIALGDINGDNLKDIAIGTVFADQVTIIYGNTTFPATITSANITSTTGAVVKRGVRENFGGSIVICDLNNDNYDDLVVNGPLAPNNTYKGIVYGLYGSPHLPVQTFMPIANATASFTINGTVNGQSLGDKLGCGDLNGDGLNDLFLGASFVYNGQGYGSSGSYVLFSYPTAVSPSSTPSITPTPSKSNTPTPAPSKSPSTSRTPTPTPFASPSVTPSNSPSKTPFASASKTPSVTPSVTSSISVSPSTGASSSVTPSSIPSPSLALSVTPSVTYSTTPTPNIGAANKRSSNNSSAVIATAIIAALSGTGLLGAAGYAAYRKYKQYKRHADAENKSSNQVEMQPSKADDSVNQSRINQPQESSSFFGGPISLGARVNKGYTSIGGYELINKITEPDAKELKAQTRITIPFKKGKKKAHVTFGAGQYGKVRLARINGKYVGVKKVKTAEKIQASIHEAEIHKELTELMKGKNQIGIMPLLDSILDKGSDGEDALYQFMPLAGYGNGELLKAHLATVQDQVLKEKFIVHVARYLLTGAAFMHKNNIFHLDIKPANLVLDRLGHVYLIDFGCAKKKALVKKGNGDSNYFSPDRLECLRTNITLKRSEYGFDAAKADSWAIGLTLLEMLSNQSPFEKCGSVSRTANWTYDRFLNVLDSLTVLKQPKENTIYSLISQLLVVNYEQRLTPAQALVHPVFTNSAYQFTGEEEVAIYLDDFIESKSEVLRQMEQNVKIIKRDNYIKRQGIQNQNYNTEDVDDDEYNNESSNQEEYYIGSKYAFKNVKLEQQANSVSNDNHATYNTEGKIYGSNAAKQTLFGKSVRPINAYFGSNQNEQVEHEERSEQRNSNSGP